MLTTVLDLIGLSSAIAGLLLAASLLFGAPGVAVALGLVAVVALVASWLLDRTRT